MSEDASTDITTTVPPPRRRRLAPGEPIPCPFVVLIDQQEKAALPFAGISEQPENRDKPASKIQSPIIDPFDFLNIETDANKNHRMYAIQTKIVHMKTADYSLEIDGQGMDSRIVIERKSVADLFGSVGANRDRFEAEHQRMAEIIANGGRACVIIEGSWEKIMLNPPPESQVSRKTPWRTAQSWFLKYGVPWFAPGGRRMAELQTFRILEKFYEHWRERGKVKSQ